MILAILVLFSSSAVAQDKNENPTMSQQLLSIHNTSKNKNTLLNKLNSLSFKSNYTNGNNLSVGIITFIQHKASKSHGVGAAFEF